MSAARSCAGSRCPTPSSPPTGCSRRSSPCSTSSAPTRRSSTRELRALPAVPRHHQGADGRGARRRRPRGGPRGHQGARRRRGARRMREQGADGNDLLDRLAADPRLGARRGRRSTRCVAEPLDVRRHRAGPGRARSSPRSAEVVAAPSRGGGLPPRAPSSERSHLGRQAMPTLDAAPPLLRQGPRHLRRRRRPAADGHLRPHVGVRRRAWPSRSPTRAGCSPRCRRSGSSSSPTSSAATSISTDLADLPDGGRSDPDLAGRVMLCRKAEMLPIECIVRGYLTGSAWKEYKASGHDARRAAARRAAGVDAAARAGVHAVDQGRASDHDENISFERGGRPRRRRAGRAGPRRVARALPRGRRAGPPSGASSSPTPSSSSAWSTASWSLCDEVLTPDSSRFWPADEWEPGTTPPRSTSSRCATTSTALDWDKTAAAPAAARRGRRAPPAPATSRPTSASPAGRFADWPGVA